ncbi:hypothetical protein NDU88_001297 [Pleurodeles waltl]|uniref:Uncharacterized protein n=1 Tax=Pleurodeles waltl TaxID=8319 RepID=A0AAV7V7U1_PLEWA|nr:hypothetical protein NDU88_001297 [Pleurodeles waltl]
MKRSPPSTPVLQGVPSTLGISRPVSVPLIQCHFPPSMGDRALPSRGLPASLLSVFSVPVSWARGIRIRGPPLSSPACPLSSDLCAVFGFFPLQAGRLRSPPFHRWRLCGLSARHFACGPLQGEECAAVRLATQLGEGQPQGHTWRRGSLGGRPGLGRGPSETEGVGLLKGAYGGARTALVRGCLPGGGAWRCPEAGEVVDSEPLIL